MTIDPLSQSAALQALPEPGLEPAELLLEAEHPFSAFPKVKGETRKPGCRTCRALGDGVVGRYDHRHLGAPPSMNDGGSGMDRMAYQTMKQAWAAKVAATLRASPASAWPRPVGAVMVEAQIGLTTYAARDEGNMRWMIEKVLGDVLKDEGVLEDDTFFPVRRYSFGGLTGVHSPKRSFTRLVLFPAPEPEPVPRADGPPAQLALDG